VRSRTKTFHRGSVRDEKSCSIPYGVASFQRFVRPHVANCGVHIEESAGLSSATKSRTFRELPIGYGDTF
jgi:hypothetical protein